MNEYIHELVTAKSAIASATDTIPHAHETLSAAAVDAFSARMDKALEELEARYATFQTRRSTRISLGSPE